jgi:hypothetical protein
MERLSDKTALLHLSVTLQAQPRNAHDNYAIEVLLDGIGIGYVPKGLSKGLFAFTQQQSIEAHMARVNGTIERPSLVVLARVGK